MRPEPFQRLTRDMSSGWRLERRIPLAVLGALIAQGAAVVMWATWLEARVEAVEHAQAEQTGLNEKFARLEERIDSLRGDITRLSRQLERMSR